MAGRRGRVRRWLLLPLLDRATWTGGALLVGGAAPALGVLLLAAVGVVAGTALTPVGVGVPVLVGSLALVRATADVDRRLFVAALGADADREVDPTTARPAAAGGWVERARALAADPRTWRSTAWLAVRSGAGLLVVAGLLVTVVVAVALLAVPFVDGYLASGATWRSSSGWASAWTLPVAGLLLLGAAHGFRFVALAHVRLAELLLGPDPAERLAVLQRAVERADARDRVARDLHDGLGHALTLVVVQAEAAATALDDDRGVARRHLDAVTAAARAALGDLDRALDVLHGAAAPAPGLRDLPDLVRAARAAGLDVSYEPAALPAGLDVVVSEAAYRVVQEGLTNALRHTASRSVALSVAARPDGVRVLVTTPDDAQRGAFARSAGRGLAGLRDRVEVTGGAFDAGARAGTFVVEAVWPRP